MQLPSAGTAGSRNDAPGRRWRESSWSSRNWSLFLLSVYISLAILPCSEMSSEYKLHKFIKLSPPSPSHWSKCSCVSWKCDSSLPHLRGQCSTIVAFLENLVWFLLGSGIWWLWVFVHVFVLEDHFSNIAELLVFYILYVYFSYCCSASLVID